MRNSVKVTNLSKLLKMVNMIKNLSYLDEIVISDRFSKNRIYVKKLPNLLEVRKMGKVTHMQMSEVSKIAKMLKL